ncbi:invasion associated locus B family protein [uncultured Thiothrix sp.]|uniref:invasion associated locus B family protein n=1 Tax=uncultured Thiothrix sp. TaxID=223185 RepID=UPI00261E6D78|nr:invasion associated locus B family protein [uncultured Thiothrix sp.]HMT94346.1 invasion associated locus B family protein [Thiolinea sp.]
MGFCHLKLVQASLFSLFVVSIGTQAAGNVQGKRFQDWGGNCQVANQVRHCYLEQVLHDGEQKVMVSVIGYLPGQKIPSMAFELPPNIHLPSGFTLSLNERPTLRFKGKCSAQRCTASFQLTPKILQQFQKGQAATVSYLSTPNQRPVNLPLSLMGISAGLNALK